MGKIPFIKNIEFAYGDNQRLSALVSRVMCNNPGPFTYTGTGVFIIGTKSVAIIDPGPNTKDHAKAVHQALHGKTLTHILLTHHHADHSPLAGPLAKQYGAPIYGLPAANLSAQDEVTLEEGNDPDFKPDIRIGDKDFLHGPDWTVQAIHTPGHTSNHVCYALHQENTLFSGDHIMGWATSVVIPPDGHMGSYIDSLHKIHRLGFDTIRPTHGPAITDVNPFLDAYIAHRHDREAQIEAAVKSGHDKIMAMVEAIYTDIDQRLFPAAALSVLAHLIRLTEQGKISSDSKPGLSGTYRPI